jgi:hypothetical protein
MRDEWGSIQRRKRKRASRVDKQFAEAAQRPSPDARCSRRPSGRAVCSEDEPAQWHRKVEGIQSSTVASRELH